MLNFKMGTTVKNPVHRAGRSPYSKCRHCEKLFTQQGISRHWDKCVSNPKNNKEPTCESSHDL